MFGDRCYGLSSCGHSTNWTCPCTCDEDDDSGYERSQPVPPPAPSMTDAERIEGLLRYVAHDVGCSANDLDPLDHAECACGLRRFYNPFGRKDPQ